MRACLIGIVEGNNNFSLTEDISPRTIPLELMKTENNMYERMELFLFIHT